VWVAWRESQGFDAATVTPAHIKRYRQALLEAGYIPITIRWKLTIVRRFYEAASNTGELTIPPRG
jgi:site-specific recombinase XerD